MDKGVTSACDVGAGGASESAGGMDVGGSSTGADCSATGGVTGCESSLVRALSVRVVGVDCNCDGVASDGMSGVEGEGGLSLDGVEGALSAVGAASRVAVSPAQARYSHSILRLPNFKP